MRHMSALILFTLASVAMAKMRCMCSKDGNGIDTESTLYACQGAMNYGVEADGFCYIADFYSSRVLLKCNNRDTSYCQKVTDR
ncbi:MAG: hypothetical protein J3R72DRAFT_445450 [Linnemannia gamsii]|nr:MAG: hypothetical protein J3R72DRAFT_445450 [Linnemannia gamsii]